jgi:hypothetical protein
VAEPSNTNVENEKNAIGSTSSSSAMVKESFSAWLSDGNTRKYSPAIYLTCMDKVSGYLIGRKIACFDLWQYTNFELFKKIYNKAINDGLFRATDTKTHAVFVHVGQAFMKFLKSKPAFLKVSKQSPEIAPQVNRQLTIKDAVISVLEISQRGMTVEEIYNKIIENRLYSFGAQNPQDVVRVEIDRACVNSNYTIRASKDYFRFERNQKGEKIYFLLSSTITDYTIQPNIIDGCESAETVLAYDKQPNIEIWNDSIKRNFKIWMKSKNYALKTVIIYCGAINRTINKFKPLSDLAASEVNTLSEAVRRFVSLLNQDYKFDDADSIANGHLSAALTALEQFAYRDIAINTATVAASTKKANNAIFTSMIVTVLLAHYPNGFRLDSPIELLRFRRFVAEDFGEEVALTDEELKQSISICGTFFNGKIYIVSIETEEKIKNEVDAVFKGGMEIIFYEAFYEKHEDWLFPASVISVEMLKCILLKLYPNYKHRANYITNVANYGSELAKIEREIVRVWGNDILLNYEQLADRLMSIPFEKIKYVLAYSCNFIWNSEGIYTHVNKVDITKQECAAIIDYVAAACRADGYASLSEVPLGEIKERNYELSLTAIHNAVFGIVLADKYDRRGKIVTRKGNTLDALTIMKEHCRTLDKCSLQDLFGFERELTGESHRWIPMEAGYSVMVRADEDSYIAEKYVHFDATEIDGALDLFVTGEYLPLKSVTTFVAFPHCGHAWNLFLLESYCRRFSDRFRFDVLAVNSKNAGAIVRKSCRLSYVQIMVDSIVESDIPLEKTAIEEFLYNSGYIGRRSYAKTNELIEQAKTLRERKN